MGREINPDTKILISYHNPSWEPILTIATKLGLRKRVGTQNWLDQEDLKNILVLSGFEVISSQKRFFGITTITVARPINPHYRSPYQKYSVSIIVPARNEEGNIAKIIPSIPVFGKWQEIIFIEGHSKDNTWGEIQKELSKKHYKLIRIKSFKQRGKGKADAVRFGFEKAAGDVLMIYDADRTVPLQTCRNFTTLSLVESVNLPTAADWYIRWKARPCKH